jgi:hypothetical protein
LKSKYVTIRPAEGSYNDNLIPILFVWHVFVVVTMSTCASLAMSLDVWCGTCVQVWDVVDKAPPRVVQEALLIDRPNDPNQDTPAELKVRFSTHLALPPQHTLLALPQQHAHPLIVSLRTLRLPGRVWLRYVSLIVFECWVFPALKGSNAAVMEYQ